MGYPKHAQAYAHSPYGSSQAVATQRVGERQANQHGVILPPCEQAGHWATGWVGGLQLLPGAEHRWIAVVTGSASVPNPSSSAIFRAESPSLGGFAFRDEAWPVCNWQWPAEPIEWIEQVPPAAQAAGEGTNLWWQHILVLADKMALFYNSGAYGREQVFTNRRSCLFLACSR